MVYYFQFWVFAGSIVFSGDFGRGGAGCGDAVSIGEVTRAWCLLYACVNVNVKNTDNVTHSGSITL